LLTDILRGKWGFGGHVVSDCWAIKDFHEFHKVTATATESVAMAVKNGCDLNCGNLFGLLLKVIEEGLLTEADIDRAVTRLMATRLRLGIIGEERPVKYDAIPYEVIDNEEHRALNLEAARKSLVLLKNDGALPFKNGQLKTIAVIGPNADSRTALEGNYQGTASEYVTVLEGVRALTKDQNIRVLYAPGCHLHKNRLHMEVQSPANDRLAEALAVTRHSDAVVLCLGLDASLEGEEGDQGNAFASGDKTTLSLPGKQQELLKKVVEAAKGKPVIVVVISGSALDVCFAHKYASGVIQAFYPGARGGLAVAEVLFGKFSPEGRLPLTFYKSDADLPDFRDYAMTNRTYRYFNGEPLYPFGYGLGFAKFFLSEAKYTDGTVTVSVRNNGGFDGEATATVQVYAKVEGTREHWNLCGLAKVSLAAGEEKTAGIKISEAVFGRYDAEGQLQPIDGAKTLYVGLTQPDERSVALTGVKPIVCKL
jgi:beta-glucosidase